MVNSSSHEFLFTMTDANSLPTMNLNNLVAFNVVSRLLLKLPPTNYYSWKSQFDALLLAMVYLATLTELIPVPPPKSQLMTSKI